MAISLKIFILIAYIFSLTFDFKRKDGDFGVFTTVLGVINILLAIIFISLNKKIEKKYIYVLFVIVLFGLSSSIVGILRGQEVYSNISAALPVLIFVQAALISASYPKNSSDLNLLIMLVVLSGFIAAIWKFLFAFGYYDINLENIRYQILSGATPLLFSYGLSGLLVQRRRYVWFALSISVGVVLFSVTRTYILVFMACFFSSIFLLTRSNQKLFFEKKFLLRLLIMIMAMFFGMVIFPFIYDRWIGRLFSFEDHGADLTALTRIAEINGQIESLAQDHFGLLFGFGMAAVTNWTGDEFQKMVQIIGASADVAGTNYGHNFYIGSVYVGGILFGIPMLSVLLRVQISSYRLFRRISVKIPLDERFAAFWGITSGVGYCTYGLLGGTFVDRSIAFYYGIAFGLQMRFFLRYKLMN